MPILDADRHTTHRSWPVFVWLVSLFVPTAWAAPVTQDPLVAEPALIEAGAATIHVLIEGEGRPIVLLPALGRGAADFSDLSARLVAAGFQVVRPPTTRPRCQHGTDERADPARPRQRYRGRDSRPGQRPGHAGRPRLWQPSRPRGGSRSPAVGQRPVLLAAEERQPARPEVLHARLMSYDPSLPQSVRRQAIQQAFFAAGNDPVGWQDGWYQKATRMQMAASLATEDQALGRRRQRSDPPVAGYRGQNRPARECPALQTPVRPARQPGRNRQGRPCHAARAATGDCRGDCPFSAALD